MASTACARCRNLLTRRLFKSEMLMMPTAVHTKLPMISRLLSTVTAIPHVCIVGSGPAGFYTAQQILKSHKQARVDMVEKLPVPFGLVRFGVAPDHPEVKSYGAEDDRVLGIGGESLHGVYSARSFVGWYNGLPEDRRLNPDLSSDTAVVIGHGNVALDVARILLTPVDILQKTDITQHAIEALKESRVKTVYVVGRRGPLQVAFTIKELREMTKLPGCKSVFDTKDFEGLSELVPTLPRPRKRLTELMIKTADGQTASQQTQGQESPNKEWRLKFLRSPIEIVPSEDGKRVAGIRLEVNELKESEGRVQALPTGEEEILQCGLILRSIGYKSLPIDDSVPFDAKNGVIPNTAGRVSHLKGFYCSGWVRRGPTGVILSTMTDGFETGKSVVQDIESGELDIKSTVDKGRDKLLDIIEKKGLVPVTFDDWKRIDDLEKTRGESIGKPREKFLTVAEMLEAAFD
ncbi:NADPH:adrenodoxin oxidoreductase, mitochondrial-like isoform X2 [Ptychodera flava]|uniref:NADPH:adrenodoxin oxidoreductase, mitochondrial-like isoform X2 n=1 Tax=Ptychodera flava TaxID=63121 RepID=UPI00396A10A7